MRVALLGEGEDYARTLGAALSGKGHEPRLITAHSGPLQRVVEGRLRHRGFEEHLTHVPFSYLSLRRGSDDVAVAFHATAALAAGSWSRETGRPTLLCYNGIPHRQSITNRRGRLAILRRAIAGASAIVVQSEEARDAFDRWLGVETRVIHPPDVDAHLALYAELGA